MKKINKLTLVASIFLISIFSSCSSTNDFNKGKEQLEQQGYTDVEDIGHVFFCCGSDDSFSTGFECKNKQGKTVKGCFCSGAGKGVTIRFE